MSNYDEALERFQQVGLEYAGGLANHGPMGAEALERLGHQAKIPAFVDVYAPRLPPLERGRAIPREDWSEALGRIERAPDWVTTFEALALDGDVGTLLRSEVPGLLPGLFAAAGHGLLRVVHGLRALEHEDLPARRREVAHGLAYWAARYQTLPGTPGTPGATGTGTGIGKSLDEALEAWPLLGEADAREGYFFRVVERLDDWGDFAQAVEAAPLPSPDGVDAWLDTLCLRAAGLYVDHPEARIAYVHALTIPSGLRILLPYLDAADRVAACGYVLQAVGALHSIFGASDGAPEDDEEVVRVAGDWDETRYHAACSIQEHAIKMTEACWREDRRSPDPVFQRAGADAALKVGGRSDAPVC